ncbi:MAG: pentapeptide repeat-containing protein, partial [Deltaproteobacteria bacterium]|nr:pentapeptide repeat-containing protein [Deltaproteobacteria bacterium]
MNAHCRERVPGLSSATQGRSSGAGVPGDDAKEGIEKDPWQTRPDELEQRLAPWFDPESLCESASAREKLEARLYDIDSQRGTVDDAVRTVREILIVFMVASAYLAITVLATTDKQLLIGGASLKLPIVNAELNIVGFYLIAPWLVAVLHLNLLLKLALLSLKLALFEDAVAHAERVLPTYAERLGKVERTRLASFPIVQVLAGTRSGSSLNNLLRIFVWITLLFWPLAVLFMALIRFLPYHDPFHTWLHRGSIVFDLAILWLLWPQIINFGAGRGLGARFRALGATAPGIARALVTRLRSVPPKVPDMGRGLVASLRKIKLWSLDTQMQRMLRSRTMAAPAITAARMIPAEPARQRRKGRLALWLATVPSAILIWVATIPEEGLDAFKSAVTPEVGFIRAAVAADLRKEASPRTWSRLFPSSFVHACGAGGCDWLTFWLFEAPWSFVSRNLVVRGERLLKEEVKPEDVWELERDPTSKAKLAKFVPLDLRGRDLRYADLTDSKLIKVRLGADDRGRAANLSGALLTNATLISAEARAQFHGANLRGARLQGADLIWAKLQGADLSDALLQGAKLNGAQLQGANLLSANIQGADLSQVHLEGALLISARLQGVNLRGAQLQGATLVSAYLQGANLIE